MHIDNIYLPIGDLNYQSTRKTRIVPYFRTTIQHKGKFVSNEAVSKENIDNGGRLMGMLSIAAAPGALLISPTYFPLLAFFLALMGLTLAAPQNRYLSFIGIGATAVCGIVGWYFNTQIV